VIAGDVRIHQGAYVEDSVIMPGVRIEPGAVVRKAVLDKYTVVERGAQIGVDLDGDREQYTVSDGGVVVIGKGIHVPR
jgi:glucose-1-phosphate adenylyltransferase